MDNASNGEPGTAEQLYNEAILYRDSGSLDVAVKLFTESFSVLPHAATCRRISQTLRELGQGRDADEWMIKAYQLNSRNDKIAIEYAKILIGRSQTLEAKEVLLEILDRNADYNPAKRLLCRLR